VDGVKDDFKGPAVYVELDTTGNLSRVPSPSGVDAGADAGPVPPFETRMLLLPNRQVLYTYANTDPTCTTTSTCTDVEFYSETGAAEPDPTWKPTITSCPMTVGPSGDYLLYGTQFNGLSQANGYGDDAASATNYPLVRLEYPSGDVTYVTYCRTHDHSTMGVATSSCRTSTCFRVPSSATPGPANLVVVANGIPSDPCPVVVGATPDLCDASCVDQQTDVANCGSCGHVCTPPDECHEVVACDMGECSFADKPDGTACHQGSCVGGQCTANASGGGPTCACAPGPTSTGTWPWSVALLLAAARVRRSKRATVKLPVWHQGAS
jgi:MYXO-CTERM domain-containing protein